MRNKQNFMIAARACAAVALASSLINEIGLGQSLDISLRTTGIIWIASAIAAFFVARKQGSLSVSMMLVVKGALDTVFALQSAIVSESPGPLIGVILGGSVLALGLVKTKITASQMRRFGKVNGEEKLQPARLSHSNTAGLTRVATIAIIAIIIVAGAAGAFYYLSASGALSTSSNTQQVTNASLHSVQIFITGGASSRANAPGYSPDSITLVIGVNNTVSWMNDDNAAHTVSSTSAPAGDSFDSGNMNHGATYTHTFSVPGTYRYDCKCHSWMTGQIVVEAS